MKICSLFLLLLFIGFSYRGKSQTATPYEKEWQAIDTLIQNANQPKTALALVNKLYQQVHAKGIVDQSIKALAYKYVLDRRVTDKDESENTKMIDQALANPVNSLERSLLWFMKAGAYVNYYNRFSRKIQSRNDTLASKDADWDTWTFKDFKWKIYRAYQNALKDSAVLQKARISQYPAIVQYGNLDALRPTLYDLVVNSALDFYKNIYWYDRSNSRNAFELKSNTVLKSVPVFLQYDVQTTDSVSSTRNIVLLYQRLFRFQIQQGNKDGLVDIDNQRIAWFYSASYNINTEQKDSLYLESLRYLVHNFPKNNPTLQSVYMIASYYNEVANRFGWNTADSVYKAKRITALNYIDQYLPKDTVKSAGWYNLQVLRERITKPKVETIMIENINVPNEPILALLKFYNMSKVYAKVIALPGNKRPSIPEGDSLIKIGKPLQQFAVDLPKLINYQSYTTEIKIDPLPVGQYLLCLSVDKAGTESRVYIVFQVSNLAYMNSGGDYFVVDRKTGKPIDSVKLVFNKKNNTDPIDFEKSQLVSDKDGHIIVQAKNDKFSNGYGDAYFFKGNDTLSLKSNYSVNPLATQSSDAQDKGMDAEELADERDDNMKILYFTDRGIYRPGQKIHFKSVAYTKDGEDSAYHIYDRKDSLTFFLRDVNNKKVDSLRLKTDDFGSVSGTFSIPNNVLTGSFTIDNQECRDEMEIQVEEYKRPTFFVEIDSLKGTFHLNDSVPITGTAKAYNGSKVSNASVQLHIKRNARFPYYWLKRSSYYSWGKDILDTTIRTDAQGKFKIDFKAIPDETVDSMSMPVFQYAINADVTDNNGETRTKQSSVLIGYNSVDIQWNIGEKAKLLSFNDLRAYVKSTNGISLPFPVQVKIQPIQQPKKLLREKYWNQPDVQVMDSLIYKKYFPYDIYKQENLLENWQKENPILEKAVASDSLLHYTGKLQAGWYYLEASITSPEGKTLKDIRYVQLLPNGIPLTDKYLEGFYNNYSAYIGDTVRQYLSTAAENMYLTKISQNEKGEASYSHQLISNETLPIVAVLGEKTKKYLDYTFAGYKDNRFYQEIFSIESKPKRVNVDIKYKTYRNNIEPGSKEKWSIQVLKDRAITKDAQLLSAMYDASLDQIVKGDWHFYVDNEFRYGNSPDFSIPYNHTAEQYGFTTYTANAFITKYPQLTFENGNIQLNGNMDEVVVVGYGTQVQKKSFAGAMTTITTSSPPISASGLLGKVPGVSVSSEGKIVLRGNSSIKNDSKVLYIVDGQVLADGEASIPPSDIEVINIFKAADAVAVYGSQAANGAIIVTTKSKNYGKKNPPPLRSNFSETAFFYPSIMPDKDGNYWIEFTMPDAVTQWRWRNLAMDKDLRFGYSEMMITSQKTLMVQPNMPRFLRAGDELALTAKVSNTGQKDLEGKAFVQLLDAGSNVLHWQKIDQTKFKVAADQSSTVSFNMAIPEDYSGPLYAKVWVEGGQFSDGELHEIPVLSRKTLVTETLPFELNGDTVANMDFAKLLASDSSKTLQDKALSIELATNPVWYAVQAIPYLQSYPYECSEQVFGRMYGGFLAQKITHTFPQIKTVLDKWENDPDALKSNLQKNSELKQVFLEETPWLNNAESEVAKKRKLALYFNTDSIENLLQKNFDLLAKRQFSDGSFSWYDGTWGDRYITQNIVTQYAHLQSLQAVDTKWQKRFAPIIQKAQQYLSGKITDDYEYLKKQKMNLNTNHTGSPQLMYIYALSLDSINHKYSTAENYYLNQARKYWNDFTNVQKAWIAEIFYRKGEKSFAINTVIRSLMENAVESKTNGTYWKSDFDWGYGYLSSIETHSQIMDIVNRISDKEKNKELKDKVEEMQHWLIRNKQTNYWSNTKATADACYALLTVNNKWLDAAPKVKIQMGDTLLHIDQQEEGTGYTKISIPQRSIKSSLGKIQVSVASNPGYVYGGVYWQYLENMDKITEAMSPLSLKKTFYKETIVDGEQHLQEVKTRDSLSVGDKLIVRIIVKSDRDMQYVHLKDLRPSNTEPDDAISGYQYKNNLGYYLSIKDVSSNFFFNNISKGSHILEYSMHVTHAGSFASGLASIQCMYAPEMNGHSEGTIIEVK